LRTGNRGKNHALKEGVVFYCPKTGKEVKCPRIDVTIWGFRKPVIARAENTENRVGSIKTHGGAISPFMCRH
jgi:hypothetical protein